MSHIISIKPLNIVLFHSSSFLLALVHKHTLTTVLSTWTLYTPFFFFFFTIISSVLEKEAELCDGVKEAADKGSGDMVNRGSRVKRITEKPVDLTGVAVTVTLLP